MDFTLLSFDESSFFKDLEYLILVKILEVFLTLSLLLPKVKLTSFRHLSKLLDLLCIHIDLIPFLVLFLLHLSNLLDPLPLL